MVTVTSLPAVGAEGRDLLALGPEEDGSATTMLETPPTSTPENGVKSNSTPLKTPLNGGLWRVHSKWER